MASNKKGTLAGHVQAWVCIFIWGTTFFVSKDLLTQFVPLQVMILRFAIACLMLWVVRPVWHFKIQEDFRLLLMAIFSNTLYFICENSALLYTQTSNVSILVSTSPLFTALLFRLRYKKGIARRQLCGMLTAFVGAAMVVLNGALVLKLSPKGDILALSAAFSWACYCLLLRGIASQLDGVILTRKLMFYGLLTSFPLLLVSGEKMDYKVLFSLPYGLEILYLGLIGSGLCFLLWTMAVQKIGVITTALYVDAIPLITLLACIALKQDVLSTMGVAGIIIVVLGLVITSLPAKEKKS